MKTDRLRLRLRLDIGYGIYRMHSTLFVLILILRVTAPEFIVSLYKCKSQPSLDLLVLVFLAGVLYCIITLQYPCSLRVAHKRSTNIYQVMHGECLTNPIKRLTDAL